MFLGVLSHDKRRVQVVNDGLWVRYARLEQKKTSLNDLDVEKKELVTRAHQEGLPDCAAVSDCLGMVIRQAGHVVLAEVIRLNDALHLHYLPFQFLIESYCCVLDG